MLKNEAKQRRIQLSDSDTQTDGYEPQSSEVGEQTNSVDTGTHASGLSVKKGVSFGVDFGIDVGVQTDQQAVCKNCENDRIMISELIELLETMENSVAFYQALECNKTFVNLVQHLDHVEAKKIHTNEQAGGLVNNLTLDSQRNKSSTVSPLGKACIPSVKDTLLSQANRFHPLQHINNDTHFNQFSNNLQPSAEQSLPLIPGPKLYSETVKDSHTTMILTDSMSGGVKVNSIKKNIRGKDEQIIIKRFPGHTAEDMAFYATKPLGDTKPDKVIIVAGTNDLTRAIYDKGTIDEFEVVQSLMKIERVAREHGAKKIYVSSIMTRRGYRFCEGIKKVNDLLYMACIAEDFLFMDQAAITMAHVSADGIHLNSHGSAILFYNILSVFDTFDGDFIDFKKDYEHAMSMS